MTGAPDDEDIHDLHPVNRLILELANTRKEANAAEVQQIRNHVASVGFQPTAETRAGSRIAGIVWQGDVIHSGSRLNVTLVHYLRHVVAQSEWPPDTSISSYVESLRSAVEDRDGGILLTRRFDAWLLTFVSQAVDPATFKGKHWIAVGYGVNYGYWLTGYRPRLELARFNPNEHEGERWLRQPRYQNV